MCGIVGVIGALGAKEETAFKQLLIVDSLRGIDSTGVAVISKGNEVKIAKEVGTPYDLFDKKAFDKTMLGANRVCIGHNRWGTIGGTNRKNAHPFQFDHITGVHNGTLKNKWELPDGGRFDVDSQALYNSISLNGVKNTINKLCGAWSLVWWDDVEETINFLRNEERPMFWCSTEGNKQMFFASEDWMLEGVLWRNDIKHGTIMSTNENWHYSFRVDNTGTIFKPIVTTDVVGAPKPASFSQQVGQHSTNQQARPTLSLVKKSANDIINAYKTVGHTTLEIVGTDTNTWGAPFFHMLDWNDAQVPIRLYYQKDKLPFEPEEMIGGEVVCVISPIPCKEGTVQFFKVNATSVNWDDIKHADDPVGSAFKKPIYDHNNKEISAEDFHNKYGTCCWCEGYVNPLAKHALTRDGQGVCGECVDDVRVMGLNALAGGVRNA